MSLASLRKKIDCLDKHILEKLNERLELALKTREYKPETSDRKREIQVLKKIGQHARTLRLLNSDFAEKIFIEIIKESRRIQSEEVK